MNLALAERGSIAGLDQLYVVDVTSALGCGHLLVHISVPEDRSMPDVHLGADVCIGVAIATTHFIYPQAVGGDIGCGILAVPFDVSADCIADPATAGQLLAENSERSAAVTISPSFRVREQ